MSITSITILQLTSQNYFFYISYLFKTHVLDENRVLAKKFRKVAYYTTTTSISTAAQPLYMILVTRKRSVLVPLLKYFLFIKRLKTQAMSMIISDGPNKIFGLIIGIDHLLYDTAL